MVKGYLTRRLKKTEMVRDIVKTIKDTTQLLDMYRAGEVEDVREEDVEFHERLMSQLVTSLTAFHVVFFKTSKAEQMAYISRSRELLIERMHKRSSSVLSNSTLASNKGSTRSSATLKYMKRKQEEERDLRIQVRSRRAHPRDPQSSGPSSVARVIPSQSLGQLPVVPENKARTTSLSNRASKRPATAPMQLRRVTSGLTKENTAPAPVRRSTRAIPSKGDAPKNQGFTRKVSPRKVPFK
jgi:hypothetical protein